jgi:hypothetical protein
MIDLSKKKPGYTGLFLAQLVEQLGPYAPGKL